MSAQEDVIGRRIADSVYELRPPVDGADLRLTLDAGTAAHPRATMWTTYQKNHAHGATGLVMDVHTGAIMAMASFPSFNANSYGSTDPALFTDPAVSRQYEPGSVMKAFTVAAALDAGAIDLQTTVLDDNNLRIAGIRIQNADRYTVPYGHGEITASDVLNLSTTSARPRSASCWAGSACTRRSSASDSARRRVSISPARHRASSGTPMARTPVAT